MSFAQLVLVPLLALFVWAYLATRQRARRRRAMRVFDAAVILLAAGLSGVAGWWIAGLHPGPADSVWATVMTTVAIFHVFPAVLLAGSFLRRRLPADAKRRLPL